MVKTAILDLAKVILVEAIMFAPLIYWFYFKL